jgi:hypothetical protein
MQIVNIARALLKNNVSEQYDVEDYFVNRQQERGGPALGFARTDHAHPSTHPQTHIACTHTRTM